MAPGLRLRQARERLGLTYRDVERASYELASRRGRPEFVLHISRLADIETAGSRILKTTASFPVSIRFIRSRPFITSIRSNCADGTGFRSTSSSAMAPFCLPRKHILLRPLLRCMFRCALTLRSIHAARSSSRA